MDETTLAASDIGRLEKLHGDVLELCLRLEAAAGEPDIGGELRDLAEAIPQTLKSVQ